MTTPDDRPVERERIVLDWRRYAQMQAVSQPWLEDAGLTVFQDRIFPEMILRLERHVLADKRAEDTYEKVLAVPRSTWQMFKKTHADSWWFAWFVRWKPVATESWRARLVVERWQNYPEARLPAEKFGRAVIFEAVRGPWWEDRP